MTFDKWKDNHLDDLEFFGKGSKISKMVEGLVENAFWTGCLHGQTLRDERHEKRDFSDINDAFSELHKHLFPGRE